MRIKEKYAWLKHTDFMIVDMIAIVLSFAISYYLKFGHLRFIRSSSWLAFLLTIVLLNLVITLFLNPYSGIFRRSYYQEIIRAAKMTIYNLIVASVIVYLFKIGTIYSRGIFFGTYAIYFFLSIILKYIWKKLLISRRVVTQKTKLIPIFIVGTKARIESVIEDATAGDFQLYDIKGVSLTDDETIDEINGIPVVRGNFIEYVLSNNVHEILVAAHPDDLSPQCYKELVANGVGLNFEIDSIIGFHPEDQIISTVGVCKSLTVNSFTFTPKQVLYLAVKRLLDIICGIIGLIILVPVTIAVKVAYLLSGDTAKIFYRQTRVGVNGKTIRIFKFRSMVPNADEVLQELLKDEAYQKEWEENQKFENDPRITKVGRVLRKTSIDELPQLINVLTGDMSLVGPRPLVIGELESHDGLKLYQKVKPGITGWWGCNGRSNISYKERLELEYYYVKNCSFYLDVLCIIRTAFAVLKKEGAQ